MSYKGILGVSNAGCLCPTKAFLELAMQGACVLQRHSWSNAGCMCPTKAFLEQCRVLVFYKGILGVSNAGCMCPTKAFLELAMQGACVLQRHSWS